MYNVPTLYKPIEVLIALLNSRYWDRALLLQDLQQESSLVGGQHQRPHQGRALPHPQGVRTGDEIVFFLKSCSPF